MKMQLKSLLLFMVAIFIILTGCKKRDSFSRVLPVEPPTGREAIPAVLTTATTVDLEAGVRIGTFTAIAWFGTSGTYRLQINSIREIFHGMATFSPTGGDEFTIYFECQMYLPGTWRVVGGTGQYVNLQGAGSILMVPGHEYFSR